LIRTAAVQLFAAKGFHGTGIREIASRAGVSTSLLYHYAASKEELLRDIMDEGLRFLLGEARQALEGRREPQEALVALVRCHVLVHGHDALRVLVVDTEFRSLVGASRQAILRLRDEYESLWRAVIDDGVAAGDFQVEDARLARLALLEMCTGVAHWYRPEGPLDLEAVADRFARLGLALVGVSDAATCPLPRIPGLDGLRDRVPTEIRSGGGGPRSQKVGHRQVRADKRPATIGGKQRV
jgi:AcrR family transcriptional regulator